MRSIRCARLVRARVAPSLRWLATTAKRGDSSASKVVGITIQPMHKRPTKSTKERDSEHPWLRLLFDEHTHLPSMMSVLRHAMPATTNASENVDSRGAVFLDIAHEFADSHFTLEEQVLWKTLEEHGFQSPLLRQLQEEHLQLQSLLAEMSWAIKSAHWSTFSRSRMAEDAAAYTELQNGHAAKETEQLFPAILTFLADRPAVADVLRKRFYDYMDNNFERTVDEWRVLVERSKALAATEPDTSKSDGTSETVATESRADLVKGVE